MSASVSIIIPCYNNEQFVAEAIESALAQTHSDMEVIVVDDGSTDGSWEVIQRYVGKVNAVRQVNGGAPVARNAGMRMARGEYIQFLDADDLLLPEKVAVCLQHFDAATDVVFCNYIDEEADWLRHGGWLRRAVYRLQRPAPAWDPDDVPASILRRPVTTVAPLFRKPTLCRVGGWDEQLTNNQDIELAFRLAVNGARFKRIEETFVRVRHHTSASRIRLRPDSHRGVLYATRLMHQQAIQADRLTPAVSQALANRYATYGRIAYQRGDRVLAREAFEHARSLVRYPNSTGFTLYNYASHLIGLERMTRMVHVAQHAVRPGRCPSLLRGK